MTWYSSESLVNRPRVRRWAVISGFCHHDVARPQVADGGTASNIEGSCEYIK
jgi:hypothetical protein